MKADDFFYKVGPIETRVPWYPPDPEFLNAWRDELFQVPGASDYTFWLCGAAMESWYTTDVDVLVTGTIGSYQHLETILIAAKVLGFKHRQLIDIAWNDYYKKYLMKGRCQRRAICCESYYNNGSCTLAECTSVAQDVITIAVGNEIIKNGEILTPHDNTAVQVSDWLWEFHLPSPSQKQIERLLEGRVYTCSPVIITKDLDFKQVVPWP